MKEDRLLIDFRQLSKRHRRTVIDFVAYLKAKEELEATDEIISDEEFVKSIMRGDEDFKAGRVR